MAVSDAFLATCRTQIAASAEYTAFRTALTALGASARAGKPALWQALYGDNQAGLSPAYRLRRVVRDTVQANRTASTTPLDLEAAYRTLAAEYAPPARQPQNAEQEAAAFQDLLLQDQMS